jgi:haloalkane dehalogenase
MWAQGIFRPRATATQWGIDFIAHNLQAPTVTLHYPTRRRFIAELEKGYDYVGIAFVIPTMHKMIPMVEDIRRYAPNTKIILGGYGTLLGDDELAPYADHICRGEGVEFMREILGEPTDRPIEQPVITQKQSLFSMPMNGRVGYVFAGLGCPNGCDFCATSHYYKRRHIRFLPDGDSILRAIENLRHRYPDMVDFWMSDEDFLLNHGRGNQFLEAIRASDLPPLSLSVFGSIRALSQFSASELAEMGIDWVWIGFEGKHAGFSKMDGKPFREIFADLHRHGISVMASMIIGFDYQTPEIIWEEFNELMSLRPSMCQFLIYGPTFSTPLFQRVQAEGRIDEEMYADKRLHDGFSLAFKHPCIGRKEMEELQKELFREEFRRLGPSVFRVVDDWLVGHETLRDHPAPRARAKARLYADRSHDALTVLAPSKQYLDPSIWPWIDQLQSRVLAQTGEMNVKERILSKVAPAILWYTDFCLRHEIAQQPEFTRRVWRVIEEESPIGSRVLNRLAALIGAKASPSEGT